MPDGQVERANGGASGRCQGYHGADLWGAMSANLAAQVSWAPGRTAGMRVEAGALVLVASGLARDTFNVVFQARLAPGTATAAIRSAVAHFAEVGRPFLLVGLPWRRAAEPRRAPRLRGPVPRGGGGRDGRRPPRAARDTAA